jgi:hypothetical protein
MLSKTHTRPRSPTAPEAMPDTISDSVNDQAPVPTTARAREAAAAANGTESSQRKVPLAHPRATPPSRWRMTSQGLRP